MNVVHEVCEPAHLVRMRQEAYHEREGARSHSETRRGGEMMNGVSNPVNEHATDSNQLNEDATDDAEVRDQGE